MGDCIECGTDPQVVSKAFRELKIDVSTLLNCGSFDTCSYNRIEIASSDAWVLLALFWDDTKTCIHDHDQSECGFRILAGEIEETRYTQLASGKVREIAKRRLPKGMQVSSHYDAIHCLSTLPGQQAISLHAYSPKLDLDEMNVYEVQD